MPAVIDAPEVVAYEEQDCQEEQPQARAAHPGFWQTVKQYVKRHRVHTSTDTPLSFYVSRHPNETSPQQAAGYQKEGHWG